MREHGWFSIHGFQTGDRTLAQQMRGLEPALEEAKGKTVSDFGCAEGLIALEFARAGATVKACDCNAEGIEIANRLKQDASVSFEVCDLNVAVERRDRKWKADIVLALAILHKMRFPDRAVRYAAEMAGELLVVRWQGGSDGWIRTKRRGLMCDGAGILAASGLRLERTLDGPRDELVQYWRR